MFPTLFVSHGAPSFALEPGLAGPKLAAWAGSRAKPAAILVVSPHWSTPGLVVSTTAQPETIHDFGGFAAELYRLRYAAPGAPDLARRIAILLAEAGLDVWQDEQRGLDHGAWVPLMHLYPEADVPVCQLSLPRLSTPRDYWKLGRLLAPLAAQDVLILGSGAITHNLYDAFGAYGGQGKGGYAQGFMDWMGTHLRGGDLEALLDYRRRAPDAVRAHPTDEHLMPLFVALGAAAPQASVEHLVGGVDLGVIGMDSYAFIAPHNPTHPQ